ncbi:MAG: glycine cleavage system protein H [Bacteroidales bacterium]
MDGFTYYNLFQTKGIEYIIIIAFLLLIIPFWRLLNKPLKVPARVRNAFKTLSASVLRVPQGIFFSNNHTWAHMQKSGDARIGLDDLLLHLTGGVRVVMLKNPGNTVTKGDVVSEIDHEGKKLIIISPVSGKITAVNNILEDDPSVLNSDPYGKGWLYCIKPTEWLEEAGGFHFAAEASTWLRTELERFRDFMAASVSRNTPEMNAVYLQDGGELIDNPLSAMPDEVWKDFQEEFLK